jgi:4-carboxymuconolactone decarboxylase
MAKDKLPKHYLFEKKAHEVFIGAVEALGKTLREQGPEGAVHSHVRRAVESGATSEEIYHALMLLMSTLGYPTVSAALSWAEDILLQAPGTGSAASASGVYSRPKVNPPSSSIGRLKIL